MSSVFTDAFRELEWRGSVYDSTPGAEDALRGEKVSCYVGFDPSSASLHVGSLVPVLGLMRMQRHGHSPIAVVGGGTGMIGDPGGRDEERPLLGREQVERNTDSIRSQLERFLDFEVRGNPAKLVNNADWLLGLGLVDFLRDVGKRFNVNYMLAKESVRSRLTRAGGISYTEFSYMLLQAYDFLRLYRDRGCTFQMGGSDQWGNILAGVDLIRRMDSAAGKAAGGVHAVVYPLITSSSGEKFGKSIAGAPTLDPCATSPYRLYQFFLNTSDADVIRYLKLFTDVGPEDLGELEYAVSHEPGKRAAQRRLARDVTLLVHGQDGLDQSARVTRALFGGELASLSAAEVEEVFEDAPGGYISRQDLERGGETVQKMAVDQNLCSSGGEVRRLVDQGGLYLNGVRVEDYRRVVTVDDLIGGRALVLRRGAREHRLVRVK